MLQSELITGATRGGGAYRLARSCPHAAAEEAAAAAEEAGATSTVSACCVVASSEATAQLWLWCVACGLSSPRHLWALSCPAVAHPTVDDLLPGCCGSPDRQWIETLLPLRRPVLSGLASAGEGDAAEHYDTFFLEGLGARLTERLVC